MPTIIALNGITCPTSRSCFAVGNTDTFTGAVIATTDGGATWTQQTVPTAILFLNGVSCASPSDCTAVGSNQNAATAVLSTTNGGTRWRLDNTSGLAKRPSLQNVSCP